MEDLKDKETEKLVHKFDTVLNYLFELSGRRPTEKRLNKLIRVRKQDIEWGEVWDILNKLEDEKLIRKRTAPYSRFPNEILFLLTWDGKLMKIRDGYRGKLKREKPKWPQRHPILYALLASIGGAIISISIGLLLWWVDKQSKNQEIPEIRQSIQDANHRLDSLTSILNNIPDSLKLKK